VARFIKNLDTNRKSLYHSRFPTTRPKCIGFQSAAYKGINVWAGITSFGHTQPVIFRKNLTCDGYKVIIREKIAPFVEKNAPITILQDITLQAYFHKLGF